MNEYPLSVVVGAVFVIWCIESYIACVFALMDEGINKEFLEFKIEWELGNWFSFFKKK